MIEIENMFEDLRSDQVGRAITALRSKEAWNAEKYKLRDSLFETLKHHNYIKIVGTRAQLRMSGGIGFSYLYLVPKKKKGRFANYSGKLLRLVYYASAKDYLELRIGEVEKNQKGRCFSVFGDRDPRGYFGKVYGEAGYLVGSESNRDEVIDD
jgi:hypothetical protein